MFPKSITPAFFAMPKVKTFWSISVLLRCKLSLTEASFNGGAPQTDSHEFQGVHFPLRIGRRWGGLGNGKSPLFAVLFLEGNPTCVCLNCLL